jgi:hypothetical protein
VIALLDEGLALSVVVEGIDIDHPIVMAAAVDSPLSRLASVEAVAVPGLQSEPAAAAHL